MASEKLFPPILNTKLPAFVGNNMTIPFTMNKTVSIGDISGMKIIVKTAQTGKTIGEIDGNKPNEILGGFSTVANSTQCKKLKLKVGQYYKIQIAYVKASDGTIGYYSSAGIIKKTAAPTLEILEFKNDTTISNKFEYTGKYFQKSDPTEKVYSYQFMIKDLDDNIIETSGEQLHDASKDELNNESVDVWVNNTSLEIDKTYKFSYSITTVNGYQEEKTYIVMVSESVDINLDIDLETKLNYDDGSIELYLLPRKNNKSTITGDFVLVRSSSLNDYKTWDIVYNFTYINVMLDKDVPTMIWEDLTVHQGESYKYAIQAYNSKKLYSNRLESKNGSIKADFDSCFLTDAEHQLKICFNPKVSSFKTTVVESKMNTLGSKYPYIFKNGFVEYKEFPIQGLLSLISDENGKFDLKYKIEKQQRRLATPGMGKGDSDRSELNSENIYNERLFKNDVLSWLNNGKPKMFRSATEGNFIVRLMNISLAPNDTLGRMLHTFSCTAYEIDDFTFKNLKNQGLVFQPKNESLSLRIGQIVPKDFITSSNRETLYPSLSFEKNDYNTIGLPPSYAVSIVDAEPYTCFELTFNKGDPVNIMVGSTGTYVVPIYKEKKDELNTIYLTKIKLLNEGQWKETKINFEYYEDKPFDTFNEISDIQISSEIRRFVGPGYNRNLVEGQTLSTTDFDRILKDLKREPGLFYFIRVEKRFVQSIWPTEDNKYSRTDNPRRDIIQEDEWNPLVIYYDEDNKKYFDGSPDNEMEPPDYRFCLNNEETVYSYLGINETTKSKKRFSDSFGRIDSIRNVEKVTELRAGTGLFLDVGYRMKTKVYSVENDLQKGQLYTKYINAKTKLTEFFKDGNKTNQELKSCINELNVAYKKYLNELDNKLREGKKG